MVSVSNLNAASAVSSSDPFSNSDQSLLNWLQRIYVDPTDPNLISKFMDYLMANPSAFSNWMMSQDKMDQKLPSMLYELFLKAFYMGLPSSQGGTGQGGAADADAFIKYMRDHLPQSGPFHDVMSNELDSLYNLLHNTNFVADNTNAQGERTWTLPNGCVITWDPTKTADWEDETIKFMIGNCETSGSSTKYAENPYVDGGDETIMNKLLADYHRKTLDDLWAGSHNIMLLIMMLVMMYDNGYQIQISGSAATTDDMTKLTQSFTTPMAQLAQKIGYTFDKNDAQKLVSMFSAATAIVNAMPQTSSFKDTWNSSVVDTFRNASTTDGTGCTGNPTTIGTLLDNYLQNPSETNLDKLTYGLQNLNPTPASGAPVTNPGYTQVVNAFQTAGSMPTGQSKIEAQKLQIVTSLEQQDDALGKANTSTTGGGFMQFLQMLVNNQVSR
jgi:hypothetical protein